VEIAELLGFLSYEIISVDGTLFPTNARYKGCTYFCDACQSIEFKGLIENVHRRILYRLSDPAKIVPEKLIRIRVECPSPYFPQDVKRPKVELLTLCVEQANPEKPSVFNQIFGLKDQLQSAGLDIVVKRGVLEKINLADDTDSFLFRHPSVHRGSIFSKSSATPVSAHLTRRSSNSPGKNPLPQLMPCARP